jgi:hypothetical protein
LVDVLLEIVDFDQIDVFQNRLALASSRRAGFSLPIKRAEGMLNPSLH